METTHWLSYSIHLAHLKELSGITLRHSPCLSVWRAVFHNRRNQFLRRQAEETRGPQPSTAAVHPLRRISDRLCRISPSSCLLSLASFPAPKQMHLVQPALTYLCAPFFPPSGPFSGTLIPQKLDKSSGAIWCWQGYPIIQV